MTLIGLTGKAGCGKDTVGDMLKADHGFATTSFAFPIKLMICTLLRVDMDKWSDREWRETVLPVYGCTPRQLAQTLGTEWGRECIKPSIWCDLALERVTGEGSASLAITDVRFDNEADKIRRAGGYIVGVYREVSDLHPNARGHASEDGIDPMLVDFHIYNHGTLDDLTVQVARMATVLGPKG